MVKQKSIFLSVIIPLYNEEKRLRNLKKVYDFLKKSGISYEIILVNDGSKDSTLKKIKELPRGFKYNLISYERNRGKGFAIKQGVRQAQGAYILFSDIDLSTPIEELNKFVKYLKTHHVVIGTRKTGESKLGRRQSFLRENLGKGFTFLSSKVLDLNINDFTCGFKLFSKKAAKDIFKRQRIERWGFDSEILFLANKLGYRIKEVPVDWTNDPRTRVSIPRDILQSLVDLGTIRFLEFRKLYSKKDLS